MNLNELGQLELSSSKYVQLLPYKPRPFKQFEYMTDQEIISGAGGTLVFDIEAYKNYFCICFQCIKTNKVIKLEVPFNVMFLSWIMHNYTVIGFNSLKFDIPLVWASYQYQDTEFLKTLVNKLIFENVWRNELAKDFNFIIHKTSHIDIIEVCPLRGSLKLYGARLHAPRIQELPYPHDKILTEEEKIVVANYCINDLDNTKICFENLQEQLKLRYDLSLEYKMDLMSKSDAQIAESVIGAELKNITGVWPKKPVIDSDTFSHSFEIPSNLYFQTPYLQGILDKISKIKFTVGYNGRLNPSEMNSIRINIANATYRMGIGGLHSSEENVAVKSDDIFTLYDRDVASFYPRIVLNLKLYPKHLGEPFLLVYNGLVIRRLSAKEAKRIAESENLKVTINGTFGKTGSPYSILYAPEMTIQITVGGQLYLLMLIEMLELRGIIVVSANTDGIVIKCSKDKRQEMLNIIKQWEKTTQFETEEAEYKAIYSRDVNAYMAIKPNGEVKGKNVYYDPWRGKSAKDKYWRFQKNPTTQICVEAVENLIVKNIPIETTIKECTDITKFVSVRNVKGGAHKNREYLGKVIRYYYKKGELGTINYITNGNKVPDTEGAFPAMDLPEQFPNDIDYSWYERKTKDLLYEMAYLSKPKQIRFF